MPSGNNSSGVVIDVSLNQSAITSAINFMVEDVDKQLKKLTGVFDTHLSKVEQRLKNLGKGNNSSVSRNKQEQQSVSELGESYDKLARAMQMKAAQNSKRFDVSEIQQYRMRLHEIEVELRRFEQIPLINKDYNKAFAEIRQHLADIARRRSELENKGTLSPKDSNELRYIISEYERLRKIMYDISRFPIQARQDPTGYVERLKTEYIQIKAAINEMGNSLVKANQEEIRLAQSAERAKAALENVQRAVGQPFDVKSYVKDLTSTNTELQLMSKFYKEQEKDAQNAAQSTIKAEQQRQAILKQTQQSLENVNSLQQLSSQIKKRYDVSDIQNYRMQLHELESQMKRLELLSTKQGIAKYNQLGQEIDAISQKIATLRGQQDLLRQSESSDKGRKTALIQEYERISKEIDVLIRKQQELRNQQNAITPDSTQAGKLQQLRNEYERIQIAIRNMGQALIDEENAAARAAERQSRALQEIIEKREQANRTARAHSGIEIGSIAPATESDIQRRLQLEEQEFNEIERIRQASRERLELEGRLVQVTQQRTNTNQVNSTYTSYEQLRQAIAQTLNLQAEEVTLVYATDASYKRLNTMLTQLKSTYSELNSQQRNSQKGQSLVALIHETERGLQKIKQQMATPLNLSEAMGHPEKTLNDIIYKMQQLSLYRANLNFGDKNQANEIQQVNNALDRLKKKQQEIMGSNKQLQDSNTWLARSFQYMKNRLAFYFTIGASTQFLKNLIEIRSQYEMTERALGILVDSAERGSQIFNELSDMALKSPFTLIELSNAAKQLTAYDVAARDVVDTTRRLADMASAVGVNIDRLTYALGQVKAYGYLNARDARMFANAGIPLVKQLSDYYTELEGRMVSVGDVYDRIKKKAVGYEDTMAVITKMTDEGGKFFDFQAKMADTLRVQLANLSLAWNNMLNSIGQSNQGLLTFPIKALKELFLRWRQISATTTDLIIGFGALKVVQFSVALGFEKMGLKASVTAIAGTRLTNVLKGLKASMVSLANNPWTWIFLGITALTELGMHIYRTKQDAEELRAAIEKSADDSVKSLQKFKELNKESIADLNAGILKPEDTSKLWDSIREELENSADSSSTLVAKLLETQDVGERVKQALEFSDRIEEANVALKNMHGELIEIKDDLLWGAFGEGMITDIKDWVEQLKVLKSISRQSYDTDQSFENVNFYAQEDYLKKEQEALIEIQRVAIQAGEAIESALGEQGLKDKVKLAEAVARVKQQIKLAKPEIQGEIADWFDMQLDRVFSIRWAGFYDETTTLWDKLMEELKKDNSSLFNNITEDWLDGTEKMTDAQKKAFTDAANHLKQTLPPKFTETLDAMMADLNSRDFRIRVGISFNVSQLDAVQRDFNRRFLGTPGGQINVPMVLSPQGQKEYESRMQKYSRFNRKENESTLAWQKRLSDEYKNQNDDLLLQQRIVKQTSGDRQKAAQAELETDQEIISILKEIAGYEGLDLSGKSKKEKKTKTNKSRVKEEDLVAKALSQELSVIREMQSAYDKLRKAGVNTTDALTLASSGYDRTLKSINATLSKYGISPFKAEDFVGSADPHKLLTALQNQLDTLIKSGKVKTASLKDLEMEIKKVTVDAKEYDMKRITDGLNNELGKIKEEYELAVELDANPELGDMFAQAFGIDTTGFPKTVQEAVDMMQDSVDKAIAKVQFGEGIDIDPEDLLNTFDILRDDIDEWSKETGIALDSNVIDAIQKMQKEARDLYAKDAKQTISDWQKLLEKYAEYETKRNEIQKKAEKERETARKHGASQEIFDAIDLKERRELAKLEFDEFQKSATWITATGDLSNLTNKALQMLIDRLWEYKRAAKNLDPKEIIKLNNAMRKLRKEQKKENPFAAWSIMLDEAKQRMEQYQPDIDELNRKIQDLMKKQAQQHGILSDEDNKTLGEYLKQLERLKKEQGEVGKLTLGDKLGAIQKYSGAVKEIADSIISIADGLGAEKVSKAAEGLKDALGIIDKAEAGYKLGGKWGAIAGALVGITEMVIKWADNDQNIVDEITRQQRAVKELENQYKSLDQQIKRAYGSEVYAIQKAQMYNKQLQLDALEEQLRLEESRAAKHKDEDTIISLKGQIIDLKNEIHDMATDVVNDMLGITSVGDIAENMVKSMIEAFKSGEDYMKVFEESFEDMIDNMIMKAVVSRLIGDYINKVFDSIYANALESERAKQAERDIEIATKELNDLKNSYATGSRNKNPSTKGFATVEEAIAYWEQKLKEAQDKYAEAITPTPEDIATIREEIEYGKVGIKEGFEALMDAFGIRFGQNAGDAQLSALQQGIMGITEETAGALEAYMNGVSQQVYLQSDLLTQIRDILINFGGDVTIATNAQILFELQQSTQIQMSIQSILQGWSNASGLAVRVEMV